MITTRLFFILQRPISWRLFALTQLWCLFGCVAFERRDRHKMWQAVLGWQSKGIHAHTVMELLYCSSELAPLLYAMLLSHLLVLP